MASLETFTSLLIIKNLQIANKSRKGAQKQMHFREKQLSSLTTYVAMMRGRILK